MQSSVELRLEGMRGGSSRGIAGIVLRGSLLLSILFFFIIRPPYFYSHPFLDQIIIYNGLKVRLGYIYYTMIDIKMQMFPMEAASEGRQALIN